MKKCMLLLAMAAVLLCSVAYARRIMWKSTDEPPVSLRLALALAEAELEKEEVEYYCIAASVAKTFSDGDWAFRFSSKDGKDLWVNVSSDRKVTKSEHGFEY
ncbi:MAG: hypothetical protein JW889_14070 [Verrucomicrobia bacterium]|nr:hypothetical protein [Verrucomicrobiota bacterium]